MRILLDENMPRKLLAALVAEGHEVDSVKSLQLAGIDNGALYQLAVSNYDLCFTRDAEFSRRVLSKPAARLKLVHVVIPQTRQDDSGEPLGAGTDAVHSLSSISSASSFQSGISGSSPHRADPTRLALADPKRFAAENGELIDAL